MAHVMVIGGGLSGSVTANALAQCGQKVTIVEKSGRIGGKVRSYGCKATDKCNNCGVCLVGGLWEKVEKSPNIDIIHDATLTDISGKAGDYSVAVKTGSDLRYMNGISSVVVATGFEESPALGGHLQIEGKEGIVRGLALEEICRTRSKDALFAQAPNRVAFIQCVGSRDRKEDAMYCSRVCCSYSTRAAKVIRYYYPDCAITFFYMEMQAVSGGDYFKQLEDLGIEFIKSRPLKVKAGSPATVVFDDPSGEGIREREFDLILLSDGIHPPKDADRLAEICGLGQDGNGFLRNAGPAADTGIYVAGCAKGPGRIEEVYADALAVAEQILAR
ncbi:MAG: FAD-dependent oxidoreductase [Clostridiales bacterium]|nr:FAD-dependent oxidoreductase [Clostridiales bacterium]